jgi:D-3-phosphoglycerate dehydrogenase
VTDSNISVLITCGHVWRDEDRVRERFVVHQIDVDVPRYKGQQMEEEDLLPILGRYDGILAGDDHLTRSVLESAVPRLKVISKWGIGVDGIDLDAADEMGIAVFNTPGVFGEELADYAMGFIHLLARRQHEVNARVKAGAWHKVQGVSLAGKTLGVIGLGSSGRALVKRGIASSMEVIGSDVVDIGVVPGCEVVDLPELIERADILSLHVPANAQTRHLINSDTLASMKSGAWLINTSRGSLIDQQALVKALDESHLGGAALDVFESEPVSPDSPLLRFDNVIVGSHNGSNTAEAVERTTWLAVENLLIGLGMEVSE